MRRSDGVFRQYQDKNLGSADCPHNRIGIQGSGLDVSWRDPTGNLVSLECLDQSGRDGGVLRSVADERVGPGGTGSARPILSTTLRHVALPFSLSHRRYFGFVWPACVLAQSVRNHSTSESANARRCDAKDSSSSKDTSCT